MTSAYTQSVWRRREARWRHEKSAPHEECNWSVNIWGEQCACPCEGCKSRRQQEREE